VRMFLGEPLHPLLRPGFADPRAARDQVGPEQYDALCRLRLRLAGASAALNADAQSGR
jgi:hypothetical protein